MNAADKFLQVVMLCLLGPTMLIIRKVVILTCIRHAVVLLFIRIPCAGDVRHSVFVLGCVFPDRMPCNFLHGSMVSVTYSVSYQEPFGSGFIVFPDDPVLGPSSFCGSVRSYGSIHGSTNTRLNSDDG